MQLRLWSLFALGALVAVSCQKEPRQENVQPLGNAGSNGASGTGNAGNGDSGASAGNAGTGSAANNGGDGDGDGDGDGAGSGGAGNAGTGSAANNGGDGDGDGDAPGDGDGDGDTPGDGDGDGDGDVEPPWPTPAFTKRGLLETTGRCARLLYDDFLERAEALEDAAEAYESDRSAANLNAARDAFRAAFASWQVAEAFRVGPAAPPDDFGTGGQSLHVEIHAFPHINRCSIDTNTVNETYDAGSFGSLGITVRTLGAIEYLLFQADTVNDCPSASAINTNGSWANLGASGVAARRATYAEKAAHDVVLRARQLVDAWDPAEGNFYDTLADAGDGSAIFDTQQKAFNAITAALYFIEIDIKDIKLGQPLGMPVSCGGADGCVRLLEAFTSRTSGDALRHNVRGIRKLFQGCGPGYSGLGFDDWLIDVGQADLSTEMIDALQGAEAAIEAAGTMEDTLGSNPAQVMSAYLAIKAFTDRLKSDFISVLNLAPPPVAGGDTD